MLETAPTIYDVAREAGVSAATVSRVINGGSVREETRRRVFEIATAVNYRPLAAARNMRRRGSGTRKRTYVIGHVTFRPSIMHEDPYTIAAAAAVEAALQRRTLETRMIRIGPEGSVPASIPRGECDGIIVRGQAPVLQRIVPHVPAVAIEAWMESPVCYCLIADYETGVHDVVTRLLAAGARDIRLAINDPTRPDCNTFQGRVWSGCRKAYAACGVPLPAQPWVGHADRPETGYELGRRVFGDPPDALIGPDGGMLGLYRAAAERGLKVGDDLSLVGIDGLPESAFLFPPLTVVRVDLEGLAERAAAVLGEMIESGEQRRGNEILPVAVTERNSARFGNSRSVFRSGDRNGDRGRASGGRGA